jgi:hypothetical protein
LTRPNVGLAYEIDACDDRGQLARSTQEGIGQPRLEGELLDLEKRYWQAIKDQDVNAAPPVSRARFRFRFVPASDIAEQISYR